VGFDAHGMTNNPQFVSLAFGRGTNSAGNSYVPQALAVISNGVNLASLTNYCPGINYDIRGVPRTNYNNGASQGAYQY